MGSHRLPRPLTADAGKRLPSSLITGNRLASQRLYPSSTTGVHGAGQRAAAAVRLRPGGPGLGLAGTAVPPPKPRGAPYTAPWEAAQRAAWFGALGHSTEARHALELSQHTLTQASLRTYTGHWRAFARFCAARDLCALPATPETVVLYTAWQAARVKQDGSPALAPRSFQPYLSAISTASAPTTHHPPRGHG